MTAISAGLTNLTALLLTAETYVSQFRPYLPHVQPVIFQDLKARIMFGEEYSSCHSSVCHFLQYPATLSLWASDIFSTLFWKPVNMCFSVIVRDKALQPFEVILIVVVIVITYLYIINNLINLLKPTCYVMHHQFDIQQLYALPTLYLCVLYLSENKQRLGPLTA